MVYAQQFVSFWAIMTHSSGMPVLYIIGFINYFLTYWIYKILLVKHYSKTVAFNEDLPLLSINYIRIGIGFHLIEGAVVFSNSKIISDAQIDYFKGIQTNLDTTLTGVDKVAHLDQNYFDRFSKGIGMMYFIFTLMIIMYMLIKTVFWSLFRVLFMVGWNFLTCGGQKGLKTLEYERQLKISETQDLGGDSSSNNIITDFNIGSLEKFYKRISKEYEEYLE